MRVRIKYNNWLDSGCEVRRNYFMSLFLVANEKNKFSRILCCRIDCKKKPL